MSSFEKAADEGRKKIPPMYDLKWSEVEELHALLRKGQLVNALCMAYDAGFIRGHRATVRGRIGAKKGRDHS